MKKQNKKYEITIITINEIYNVCTHWNWLRFSWFIKTKYPKLKYKIIVVLVCDTCFNTVYHSENITIFNIATPYVDNDKFELLLKSIIT